MKSITRRGSPTERSAIDWLLDADPAIRWQTMLHLTDAPADEIAAERARVATQGWGARLLALQGADGRWGGAAWNRGWDSTLHALMLLRDLGLDPACEQAQRALGLVRERVTWPGIDGAPFLPVKRSRALMVSSRRRARTLARMCRA